MSPTYAVVVPHRYGTRVPSARVYARRRLVAALVFVLVLLTLVVTLLVGATQVLASRGGAPASTPVARPAAAVAQPATAQPGAAVATYVVQPGDTLWSIAATHRGTRGQAAYVDALVAVNGGTSLQVGQQIRLP